MPKTATEVLLQRLAREIDYAMNGDRTPKRNGFVLLAFRSGVTDGARTNYVSNCERADILVALKEIVARFEGQPHVSGRA